MPRPFVFGSLAHAATADERLGELEECVGKGQGRGLGGLGLAEPDARSTVQDAELVGASGELHVGLMRAPGLPCGAVRAQELAKAPQGLDPLPLVAVRDGGGQFGPEVFGFGGFVFRDQNTTNTCTNAPAEFVIREDFAVAQATAAGEGRGASTTATGT